ncbi:MAG: hypothetical protein KDB98_11895 [Flavobacteriales bacterium]|nr:hypothetical protein [Flavobacteriales bacterium]
MLHRQIRVLIAVLVSFTFSTASIMAQTCLSNGITFTSQAEVNDFPNQYPNCNYVAGDLIIQVGQRWTTCP